MVSSGRPYTAPTSQYDVLLADGSSLSYVHVGDKNGARLPAYHRLDVSLSRVFRTDTGLLWDVGLSIFNLYDRGNVQYRDYDFSVDPVLVTDVTMLGFTPTIYAKVRFE